MSYTLEQFVSDCRQRIADGGTPADYVRDTVPYMHSLLNGDKSFLKPEHFTSDNEHYSRNAIYIADDDTMSLYALVWLPGQWTPVHDHGTWGVVGVLEGVLQERNLIRVDKQEKDATREIDLAAGGMTLLSPGAVTSFVPNPDHIHVTGNADAQQRVVSLHLYGRTMAGFYIYNQDLKTREWVEVEHNES